MSEDLLNHHTWPQAPSGAQPVDQGEAWTRLAAGPQCARFLYGLAFGLSRSLAILSPGTADGDEHWESAASQGAGCLSSCPTAEAPGRRRQFQSADGDW